MSNNVKAEKITQNNSKLKPKKISDFENIINMNMSQNHNPQNYPLQHPIPPKQTNRRNLKQKDSNLPALAA